MTFYNKLKKHCAVGAMIKWMHNLGGHAEPGGAAVAVWPVGTPHCQICCQLSCFWRRGPAWANLPQAPQPAWIICDHLSQTVTLFNILSKSHSEPNLFHFNTLSYFFPVYHINVQHHFATFNFISIFPEQCILPNTFPKILG